MIADEDFPELDPKPASDENSNVPAELVTSIGVPAPVVVPETPESSSKAPLVVVQYRPRSWSATLIPPALILLAASAILSYRVHTPDWRGLRAGVTPKTDPPRPAASEDEAPPPPRPLRSFSVEPNPSQPPAEPPRDDRDTPAPEEPKRTPAAATPTVADVRVWPPHPPSPENDPSKPRLLTPEALWELANHPTPVERPDRPSRPGGDLYAPLLPPEEIAAVTPSLPPPERAPAELAKVDPKKVWNDIEREAEAKRVERERLEALKPELQRQDEIEARRREEERFRQQRLAADRERVEFLKQLREIVQTRGRRSGPLIRQLCDRHAANAGLLGRDQEYRARSLSSSRTLRLAWVDRLRSLGIAESAILEDLERIHFENRAARNGPRTEDDAFYRAALELLAVPLTTTNVEPASLKANAP